MVDGLYCTFLLLLLVPIIAFLNGLYKRNPLLIADHIIPAGIFVLCTGM